MSFKWSTTKYRPISLFRAIEILSTTLEEWCWSTACIQKKVVKMVRGIDGRTDNSWTTNLEFSQHEEDSDGLENFKELKSFQVEDVLAVFSAVFWVYWWVDVARKQTSVQNKKNFITFRESTLRASKFPITGTSYLKEYSGKTALQTPLQKDSFWKVSKRPSVCFFYKLFIWLTGTKWK